VGVFGQVLVALARASMLNKGFDVTGPSWLVKEDYYSCHHGF